MLATFTQPFGSRWIFDVELLARMISLEPKTLSSGRGQGEGATQSQASDAETESISNIRPFPVPHSPLPTRLSLRQSVYERPLDHWQDIAGSKLRRGDFFKAIAELSAIWWRYLRPGAPPFTPAALPAATLETMPAIEPRRAA
jgi:hypothetical protein